MIALKQALSNGLKFTKVHKKKTMENVRKHRDIKLVTTEKKKN